MGSPDRANVRRYAASFGCKRVSRLLGTNAPEYIAVYGSLRAGFALPYSPALDETLVLDRGACLIPGRLHDLGEYPGLTSGDGVVQGELLEIRDRRILKEFDKYEHYRALRPDQSLYVRRAVRLLDPVQDAWVYIYNQDCADAPLVASGDWAAHLRERRGSGSC